MTPERVFDAHAHVRPGDAPWVLDDWRTSVSALLSESQLVGGLFTAYPKPEEQELGNEFLLAQLAAAPDCRGLLVVGPQDEPAAVGRLLDAHAQLVGFKPYHTFADRLDTFQAPLADYLPEWCWELADERELVILIHLVRQRALADPENLGELRSRCQAFPRARAILAHAGRGFHAPDTVNGVRELRGLGNLWFDTSAICESPALLAILDEFGPRRLLWGSDWPVSEQRGKCVTVGDSFAWINPKRVDTGHASPAIQTRAVGEESLAALAEAARLFGLADEDLRDIFHDNAARLYGLPLPSCPDVQARYRQAKTRIPGGTQLLSKRPEMFAPNVWPAYFREARGCEVIDTDGNRYLDFSYNGIGSCLLGYRDPEVTAAVRRRLNLGAMSTLNPPEELELAERLCELHPWAEAARFARTGGEIASVAVRIARATTGRDKVAICGYHGWHDWYLAANLDEGDELDDLLLPGLEPTGVPQALRGTTLSFQFNDLDGFGRVLANHGPELAAIVMEPCRHHRPKPGFLETIREETQRRGILLVFDEITVGFRLALGGAHLHLGITPDLAVFAKALGNGHPMAAVIGTASAMTGAQRSFISSTYWTESIGPAAALAVLAKMERVSLPDHLAWVGRKIRQIWRDAAGQSALPFVVADGFDCMPRAHFDHPEANVLKTLFTTLMLDHGFLATLAIYPTFAHDQSCLDRYAQAVRKVFAGMAEAIARGDVAAELRGPEAHTGFRRLVD